MKWFLELATSGLGEFLACLILLSLPFDFAFLFYNRHLRSKNIQSQGWPPFYCDADGSSVRSKVEDEEDIEDAEDDD